MTGNDEESALVAKINCSDSPICVAWRAMNSSRKGLMLVEGPLSSMLLLANENKLGHKTIKKMKIIAVAARRGFKFLSIGY